MTSIIITGLIFFIVLCFAFSAYLDYRVRLTELLAYVNCAIDFDTNEFYINYHNTEPVSGIVTVIQFKSKRDYLYTFIYEDSGVIRIMVNERKCMALRTKVNIVRGDELYQKLYELKDKLITEDK